MILHPGPNLVTAIGSPIPNTARSTLPTMLGEAVVDPSQHCPSSAGDGITASSVDLGYSALPPTDVLVHVGGQQFRVHRAVLVGHSGYFRAVFWASDHHGVALPSIRGEANHRDEEGDSESIQQRRPHPAGAGSPALVVVAPPFPSLTAKTFATVLDFLYSSRLYLDEHNVSDVLACAQQLGMPQVVEACRNFLLHVRHLWYHQHHLPVFPTSGGQGVCGPAAGLVAPTSRLPPFHHHDHHHHLLASYAGSPDVEVGPSTLSLPAQGPRLVRPIPKPVPFLPQYLYQGFRPEPSKAPHTYSHVLPGKAIHEQQPVSVPVPNRPSSSNSFSTSASSTSSSSSSTSVSVMHSPKLRCQCDAPGAFIGCCESSRSSQPQTSDGVTETTRAVSVPSLIEKQSAGRSRFNQKMTDPANPNPGVDSVRPRGGLPLDDGLDQPFLVQASNDSELTMRAEVGRELAESQTYVANVPTASTSKVVIDVACCDGPVKFQRVLNENCSLVLAMENEEVERSSGSGLGEHAASHGRARHSSRSSSSASSTATTTASGCSNTHQRRSRQLLQKKWLGHMRKLNSCADRVNGNGKEVQLTGQRPIRTEDTAVIRNRTATTSSEQKGGTMLQSGECRVYHCVYCRHTFKSRYCYIKHKRRHLNPLMVDSIPLQKSVEASGATKVKSLANEESEQHAKPPPQSPRTTLGEAQPFSETLTEDPQTSAPIPNQSVAALPLEINVPFYPCKMCGGKFPSYYFVRKHHRTCTMRLSRNQEKGNEESSSDDDDEGSSVDSEI